MRHTLHAAPLTRPPQPGSFGSSAAARRLVLTAAACWAVAVLAASPPALGCSTFRLVTPQETLFAKNYDWHFAEGYVMVNKRQTMRRSKISDLTWTSTYGNVTFNQYGRNSPSGGINEQGVVVELMWHDAARYPGADERPAIGNLEWIQYQLDTAATVADIIASDAEIRILHTDEPLHFLVADGHGDAATIEFLDGSMVVHRGDSLPVAALTNNSYRPSLDFWKRRGETAPPASTARSATAPHLSGNGSLQRFARAAQWLQPTTPPTDGVAYAFDALADLAQGPSTQWSIVYEIQARRLHFKVRRGALVSTLNLEDLDFSCSRPVQFVDLLKTPGGDLKAHLQPYSTAANRSLLAASFDQPPFRGALPDSEIDWRAQHPAGDRCQASATP